MSKTYTIIRRYTNEKPFEKILVNVFLAELRKEKEKEDIEEQEDK